MARLYGAYPGSDGYPAEMFADMSESDQIQAMLEWFRSNFEDPQVETPYDKEAGHYVYISGGPYEASDEIYGEFEDVISHEVMDRLIEQLNSEAWEWAPKPGSQFDQGELSEAEMDAFIDAVSDDVADGDGTWPPLVATRAPTEPEARSAMLRRLEDLEAAIQPIFAGRESSPAPIGHNNPPELLEIERATTRAEIEEVKAAIDELRRQAASSAPSIGEIVESRNVFVRIARTIGRFMVRRAESAANTATVVGTTYAVTHPHEMKDLLLRAAKATADWLATLPWPF